jgi:Uma2 family endonuclease
MNMILPPLRLTPEDLLKMSDGNRYELVEGRPKEICVSALSSYIAGVVFGLINDYLRSGRMGWLFPEGASYRCFPTAPTQVRRPDVSFILRERYPGNHLLREGHIRITPDFVVEVISPNDLIVDLNQKLLEYLDARIPLIWVIDPQVRIVWVFHGGVIRLVREPGELTGESVLPDLRISTGELFALVPAPEPAETPES